MHYIFKRFVYLLGVLLVLFQLCRILLVALNYKLFQNVELTEYVYYFFLSIKYDLISAFWVNLSFVILSILSIYFKPKKVWQYSLLTLFVITNTIALVANLVDVFYYPYTLKRITISIFDYLGTQANMSSLGAEFFIAYWYAFVLLGLLVLLLSYFYRNTLKFESDEVQKFKWPYLSLILSSYILVAACKGQVNVLKNSIGISDAVKQVENPINAGIVLNSTFTLLKSWHQPYIQINYGNECERLHNSLSVDSSDINKNVVIIILESFTSEASKLLNPKQAGIGYTPFLDSLMQESLYFTHASANGRKSMDALPAIFSSIPAGQTPFILSQNANPINSLPSKLKQAGYETYFFHGSHNATMGFAKFCKQSGIKHYYGLEEYSDKDDFDGTWGIWDEPYLQYMADHLNTSKKPFFSSVFTLTSHNPFDLPPAYKDVFPKGENGIEETMAYTDHALRSFFKRAQQMDWYANTLFVITADHAIIPWDKTYATSDKAFSVPLLFFDPGESLKGASSKRAQHIDIFPSVMGYLNYPQAIDVPGHNLFDDQAKNFSVSIINECYQITSENYLLQYNNNEVLALYDLKTDPLQQKNIKDLKSEVAMDLSMQLLEWIERYKVDE